MATCEARKQGKMRKAGTQSFHPPIIEDDPTYVASKGWAKMGAQLIISRHI